MQYMCKQCGETFDAKPSAKRKFCDRSCAMRWRHAHNPDLINSVIEANKLRSPKPRKEILQRLYCIQKMNPEQIGEQYGVQGQAVRKWLHGYDIKVRQRQIATRFKPGHEPHNALERPQCDMLNELYWMHQLTAAEIGERFDVTPGTIRKWMRDCHIDRRTGGRGLDARGVEPPSAIRLFTMIHERHMSYSEIAERYGVDQSAVQYWLDKHSIPRPTSWTGRQTEQDVLEMQRRYESGCSLQEIADEWEVSRTTISALFEQHDIEIRQDGWNAQYHYQASDGTNVRSSYEQKVSNWFYEQDLAYVYEPELPFPGQGFADFYVNGWYIEVWGVVGIDSYEDRKQEKQELYRQHRVPLIELHPYQFSPSRSGLYKRKLARCLQWPAC